MASVALVFLLAFWNPNPPQGAGDYNLAKTPHALSVYSMVRGRPFMLGVTGDKVVVSEGSSRDHLSMAVDGRFLQIFSTPLTEFGGSGQDSHETTLRKHMQYKAVSYKVPLKDIHSQISKLSNGRTVLLWSFDAHITPEIKQQLFVTFDWQTYVVAIGSAVQAGQSAEELEQWLMRIAQSFRPET